jgi:2-polyprenyl-6-methoxyphenol hydroxylase-like FAD-dependent oxidoreductase
MNILISGAGIAGPTLAYWLKRYGFKPTLIEHAPRLRTEGYIIDFWGLGYDIADKMGLLPAIRQKGYHVKEVREVGKTGKRIAGFSADAFNQLTEGRYISLSRGDLAEIIFCSLEGKVETIFGDVITKIEQSPNEVHVEFEHASPREFDLVIGADGLHSRVRELTFEPENHFAKYLGLNVAAFEAKGYRPRDELVYVTHTEVGQQVGRFTLRDDRTMFLFIFKDEEKRGAHTLSLSEQKEILNRRFGNMGWECPQILKALENCHELYFDNVSQIHMNPQRGLWTKGRVSLVGDAASCASLLAGQGSALAMIAAYILAGELYRAHGNYAVAFQRYQNLFAPFVAKKQKAAEWFAGGFAPKSAFGLFLRNKMFSAMNIKWIANLIAGRDFMDKIELPQYEAETSR